ncbi:MAG: class I SAM-dependent methyltransferase [Anaerolineae bacterium]|nr:class I SAM-dependent methyltransferase [Anaerolineae bacterium]
MATIRSVILLIRNLLFDWYYWPRSRREFTARFARVRTLADVVDLIFAYVGGGFYRNLKPNQDRMEIGTLAERVSAIQPKVIVEIGTRDGGTLLLWTQASQALELLVSIDLPGGIHGGGYPVQRAKLYRLFTANQPQCQLELLRVDSQTEATRARLIELLQTRPIDFLFIDGDHRYPGVRRDYELYANLVRPGGLIAFHDIRPNPHADSIQVFRLWDEIKATEQTEEIIHEPYQGRYGIGLLTKGGA